MDWVTCEHASGCTGFARKPYGICLFHLPEPQRAEALAELAPGRLVDLRGTTIDADLLGRVLAATGGRPGRTRLDRARFVSDTRLAGIVFLGDVSLDGARFDRLASFFGARFEGNLSMAGARFTRELSCHGVTVLGHVSLDRAQVARDALFSQACFGRGVSCERTRFDGYATFDGARLGPGALFRGARFGRTLSFRKAAGDAAFDTAHFAGNAYLSPTGRLSVSRVRADLALDVSLHGTGLDLRHAEVAGPLLVRLTDGQADLEGAVLHGAATITGRGRSSLTSLRDVRAPSLTLVGLDLSACRFAGIARPDGLRLKDCAFAFTPSGVRFGLRWPPLRWFSRRRALADEHGLRGWSSPDAAATADRLAALYAQLRAGVDDDGTSADFAFGAMEMRRKASRRWWLSLYWLLCGYGMRMGRAAAWFALLLAITMGAVLWTSASHAARRSTTPRPASPSAHLPR
ncbi:pentapeptide repeat-containing protein [Nonomuraea sp. NBC_01738]|uniref:pentapeptide repeat-containing protein n=1 Tax=Nonomuraea sp. NBC_01738 TaxID=2976003 RepID=UPI002E154EA2|nr:pentapeptide repeat-containing protein [Nonomuraea sp. NBC_01738]